MKKLIRILMMAFLPLLGGCEDFFNTNPDDIINNDDYISAQNEIYTGFYGVISKMQAMADHAIFLTDTRANYLETTNGAPLELKEIYNYGATNGNTYADPSCYYALIIACNDYMHKMAEYKLKVGGALDTAEEDWRALISSAIRVKAWTYMRLAQIYGKAIWFSDPMVDMKELNGAGFTHLTDARAIIDKCLDLIDNGETTIGGIEGINGSVNMDWVGYLDPEISSADNSDYAYWNYTTPSYTLLKCELTLWSSNPDYAWVQNTILNYLYPIFNNTSEKINYLLNAQWRSNYTKEIFRDRFTRYESVSSVMYNYTLGQTNRLAEYFSTTYPNQYYLRPAAGGYHQYGEGDNRYTLNCYVMADTVMSKYMYGVSERQAYESDASIPLQRGHDYHFLLAEAENAIGHWDEAATILNEGFTNRWSGGIDTAVYKDVDYRYIPWTKYLATGSRNYANEGICGFHGGEKHPYGRVDEEDGKIYLCQYRGIDGSREDLTEEDFPEMIDRLKEDKVEYSIAQDGRIVLANEAARQKFFDLQLLDEMLREYVAEGRAYGMMIRMALKYNDPSIIANRVCPKYPVGQQDDIRAKIMAGEYFVQWNL